MGDQSMEYHCAGSANDPNFADAEAILDDLAMNLPDVAVIKHMKAPKEWDTWGQHLCRRMGFPEADLARGPIIWGAGRLVGDHIALKSYAERVYGRCCQKDQRDLHMLAQENLRLCCDADAAQQQREQELAELTAKEAELGAEVENLAASLAEKGEALKAAKAEWDALTEAAKVCIERLDVESMKKVLKQADPQPPLHLRKLGNFVVRAAWQQEGAASSSTTQALLAPDALDVLRSWISDEKGVSPLFKMTQKERQGLATTLRRALQTDVTSNASDPAVEERLKKPMTLPDVSSDPVEQLSNTLCAWCRAVFGLCTWASLPQYKEDLDSHQAIGLQHAEAEVKAAEAAASVISLGVLIRDKSDPYDPVPEAETDAKL